METLDALLNSSERKGQLGHGRMFPGLSLLLSRKWSPDTIKLRLFLAILDFDRLLRFFPLNFSTLIPHTVLSDNAWVLQVIGTWDDHDYGLNDAGKEFSRKVNNQRLLLNFLDEPQDSPR